MTEFIRVTEVLSPFSGLSKVPPHILEAASERGRKVHEFIDGILTGLGDFGVGDALVKYAQSFQQWNDGKNFIPKPERFYCTTYGITGECDAIYQETDKLVLIDFKTSSKESKTWMLQGSAYAYLARQAGYNIDRLEFIHLSKEGNYPKVIVYEENFEMFLKCLDLYKYFFKSGKDNDDLFWI